MKMQKYEKGYKKYLKYKEERKRAGSHPAPNSSELQMRLDAERRSRRGAEKWLQAELLAKEEMESLFIALRDIALNKPGSTAPAVLKKAVQRQVEPPKAPTLSL